MKQACLKYKYLLKQITINRKKNVATDKKCILCEMYLLHKIWSFQWRIFSANVKSYQLMWRFTEELFNTKLHFMSSNGFEVLKP